MKFTTLVAAAALATASTAALAQDVTTADGDVVMIEKNQGLTGLNLSPAVMGAVIVTALTAGLIVAASGSSSGGGTN